MSAMIDVQQNIPELVRGARVVSICFALVLLYFYVVLGTLPSRMTPLP